MSFGQSSGPPATAKQIAYLERLLADAGFTTFREARHPLGLTQRQSGGKFTRQEASELIERLASGPAVEPSEAPADDTAAPAPAPARRSAREQRDADRAELLRGMPDQLLADELQRRGWTVTHP